MLVLRRMCVLGRMVDHKMTTDILNFMLLRLAFRCVLSSFLPSPKLPRNRTRRSQDTLRCDYYRTIYTTKSGYDGFQKLKRVNAVAREWLVHRRHSFFAHRFPVLSTSTSDPSSCPSPLFSDRSIPLSQPHPYNPTHRLRPHPSSCKPSV